MTTTRRGFGVIAILAAAFAIGAHAFAADPPAQRAAADSPKPKGITSVTDGDGNPIDLAASAITTTATGVAAAGKGSMIQRGQAWWPYASAMPPYNAIGKRVESMTADEIQVNGVALINVRDVDATLKLLPKDLQLATGAQLAQTEGFYLVKIAGFSRTQEQLDALTRAGALLGEYLNINTYIAKIPSSSLAAVKSLPFVSFVGDYQPAYKISPRIGLEEIPASETIDIATGQPKPWVFELVLHNGAYVNDVLDQLGRLRIFPRADDITSNDVMTVIHVRVVPDAVPALALIPGVKWIAEKSYAQLLASAVNPAALPMVLQNNGTYTTNTLTGWKLWNAGIDGTGQIVTMMDSGLNTKMEHFSQDIANNGTPGAAHRKVVGYDIYGGDQCVLDTSSSDGGHGTKTSQHAVGSISNMTGSPDVTHTPTVNYDNGVARGAKVYFQDIGGAAGTISPPGDLGPSIIAAIGKGSFVQNHSWGAANNSYDLEASNLDTALFNNPNMVVTVSSGNRGAAGTGTLGSPGTAKNIISVGGNDVANPNNLFIDCNWDGTVGCATTDLGSSRGPVTGAGRNKPDIMSYIWASSAVGGEQMASDLPSAMCQSDATKTVYFNYNNIGNEGGTSFAAPDVAGLAALTRDYFMQGFYPTGVVTPANVLTPSGSLVKAVILASGEAMLTTAFPQAVAINARYSSDVGYGRVNLPGALHIGGSAPFLWVQNNASLGQGLTNTSFYNINGNAIPLRVMMVYYDTAGDALQKNADLKVTIGANVYLGNVMSGSWSATGGSADATNNTEGVFLDSAHGLPASGQIKVEVIGTNNPGGMNYSLVVVGDVASAAVTQVSLDKASYTCSDTVKITVNDALGTSPVSVTLVSKNNVAATIDTQIVSCTGANGVFTGTIQTGSGIIVADGGSLQATYPGAVAPANATVTCQPSATDAGFQIAGGCDNAAAGTDSASSPLFNGGSNEYYNKYMDAGEYSSYTFKFTNTTNVTLNDVFVNLSFSGAGASKMTVYNNPIHIGKVLAGGVAGAVFQLSTDPSAAPLTSVSLDFDITSPADGYVIPKRLSQTQLLQTDDVITRLASCATFNTSLAPFAESTAVTGRLTNTWRWSGAATAPTTVSSENRTGACGSAVPNAAAMTGNSGLGANWVNNADSFLYTNFQPSLRGNGPSGQPYHYVWKWHSFYHASEVGSNQSAAWGPFYNDHWNSAVAPSGDQLKAFPISLGGYFYQTIFDYPSGGVGTWNWETANTGTADDPHLGPSTGGAPNQLILTFTDSTTGLATSGTWFAYGHEHLDIFFFTGVHGINRDIALDNDRLVYDEYYANAQAGASCGGGGQVGQVAFNLSSYNTCPSGSAVVSVIDANGVSGMPVVVTSPGTGDSEVVTLTGTAPYFSGTLNYSTSSGVGVNNGILFVLPNETLTATYTDSSPAGTSKATASTACTGGDVVYVTNTQIVDNGDNDGLPDNNETVTMDITIKNNLATPLINAKVTIYSASPNVDCISDPQALYGTVPAGSAAVNPVGDRFTFHVAPAVACSDPANPPTAQFNVLITGDGFDGSAVAQIATINLDLNVAAGTTSYSQSFTVNPGWTTGVTAPDNSGCTANTYTNDFHWCALCGNGGAGYGAWVGNAAFGTSGQNYTAAYSSSTLYSPVFTAGSTSVTMQFREAARTETTYDGAIVQYQLGAGSWTTLGYTTPAQAATTAGNFCSPILASTAAWTGTTTGAAWTLTDAAAVPTTAGQNIQFRWRLGGDVSVAGTTFGGFGVDDVTVTGLRSFTCEPNRNTLLSGCPFCQTNPNGTPCDDGNACTSGDVCNAGVCSGSPVALPGETQNVVAAADKATYSWSATANATVYDVLRGSLGALPVGPGGGDEVCFDDLVGPSVTDATIPAPGTGFWYLSRAENACVGNGTYGTQSNATPRNSTTCP